jgi:amino acid transporter
MGPPGRCMKSLTETIAPILRGIERLVLGRTKSPLERGIFHRLSLIAFFAWVGLGADGLSSSCYGPDQAYRALGGHVHLALFLALATAITVAVIAASYTQIIQLFPGGGGGYVVATRLLSPTAGVVSGCALVVDYVLTVAVSVASGVDALLSFTAHTSSPHKVILCLAIITALVLLNLRGLKESVRVLLPIFLLFVLTHAVLILGSLSVHFDRLPQVFSDSVHGTRSSISEIGLGATLFLFLRAYSMGAGTYTGIEAVSNGMAVLREPRVRTGRRTMFYMAASLAITAGGILIGYRLFDVHPQEGRTLNATLLHDFADTWNNGAVPFGSIFVGLALLAEGSLLFVAAQTGFVDGPRTLAFMAVDRWVPNRFANLSSRLVTGNGIVLMGAAAGMALIYTRADVSHLVVMYSINVFVTFTLSQLGMVRHWWQVRLKERSWLGHLLVNGTGMILSFGILVVTVVLKFSQGGWITVVITGSLVAVAFVVRRHYRRFQFAATMLNLLIQERVLEQAAEVTPDGRSAVIFVNHYDGLGLHTLVRVRALLGKQLRKAVFLSVAQVDSDQFRDEAHIEELRHAREEDLRRYEVIARSWGVEAESHLALGTDVVAELERMSVEQSERSPNTLFVAGQVVFQKESLGMRLLHNEVAFALQRRLIFRGLDIIIIPVQLPDEVW